MYSLQVFALVAARCERSAEGVAPLNQSTDPTARTHMGHVHQVYLQHGRSLLPTPPTTPHS